MNQQETQWPRFEVFKQDAPKKPHEAVGSVHAPDAEMALLSARNVFVRRPKAVSLWVAPAEAIYSMTAQELENNPSWEEDERTEELSMQSYLVFCKSSQRRGMTFVEHIGQVEAQSPKLALRQAIATFTNKPAWVWWIVPQSAITQSEPDAFESWFAPAWDKTYRHQSSYGSANKGGS